MRAVLQKQGGDHWVVFKDVDRDLEDVQSYGIEMTPALVVEGAEDFGIRFYGVPRGREEKVLKETIKMVEKGESGLPEDAKGRIKDITSRVHIRVFTTPQCIYCPKAVKVAFAFAMENPRIRAESIDATEFQELAMKYRVAAVPTLVVNNTIVLAHQGSPKDYIDRLFTTIEHLEGHHH